MDVSLCLQYYDRTSEIVGKIKEVLDVDLTSDDSKGQLEEFKKAANAYGDLQVPTRKHCGIHSSQSKLLAAAIARS